MECDPHWTACCYTNSWTASLLGVLVSMTMPYCKQRTDSAANHAAHAVTAHASAARVSAAEDSKHLKYCQFPGYLVSPEVPEVRVPLQKPNQPPLSQLHKR
jgi:hypothetical protein